MGRCGEADIKIWMMMEAMPGIFVDQSLHLHNSPREYVVV